MNFSVLTKSFFFHNFSKIYFVINDEQKILDFSKFLFYFLKTTKFQRAKNFKMIILKHRRNFFHKTENAFIFNIF